MQYDITILGEGRNAAALAFYATICGLKTAVISKLDINPTNNDLFDVYSPFSDENQEINTRLWQNAGHLFYPVMVDYCFAKSSLLENTKRSGKFWLFDKSVGSKKQQKFKKQGNTFTFTSYKANNYRLVIEMFKKSIELGATINNYSEIKEIEYSDNKYKIKGLQVLKNETFNIETSIIINASEICFEIYRQTLNNQVLRLNKRKNFFFTLKKKDLPINKPTIIETENTEAILLLPVNDVVYVSTKPSSSSVDISNAVDIIKQFFTTSQVTEYDIIARKEFSSVYGFSNLSDSDVSIYEKNIVEGRNGTISCVGINWNNMNNVCEKLISYLSNRLNKTIDVKALKNKLESIRLYGADWEQTPKQHYLIEQNDAKYDEAKQITISIEDFQRLFYDYGTNIDMIIDKAYEFAPQSEDKTLAWLKAEYWYCQQHELLINKDDFMTNRNALEYFKPELKEVFKILG